MKIKSITILYTFFLCICIFLGLRFYHQESVITSDLPELHKNVTEIRSLYEAGAAISELEKQYACQILLRSDAEYERKYWDAIEKNATVLDLVAKDSSNILLGNVIIYDRQNIYALLSRQLWNKIIQLGVVLAVGGYLLIIIIYCSILRPFRKLEVFAGNVAKGNLDLPLPMDRNHLFGSFTESFDLMREELKLAKEREFQANQSKKELVAELSHDIKTPIATIRANCELMQVMTKEPHTSQKLTVIDEKAATVEKLVDNLFHATLEELQVLKVTPTEESTATIEKMLSDLAQDSKLHIHGDIPSCLVWLDTLRFSQVLDNIIYNSMKYAGTDIDISFQNQTSGVLIRIADHGPGISEADLPFISEKFYRGENATGKSGSGLGLFLAQTFMEQMQGALTYYNDGGFVVELFLRKV